MDYSRSLLKFVKVILVIASVYWCVLLLIVASLLLGHPAGPFGLSGSDEASVHAGLILVLFIILSIGGGFLAVVVVLFQSVSQQYLRELELPSCARGGQFEHSE